MFLCSFLFVADTAISFSLFDFVLPDGMVEFSEYLIHFHELLEKWIFLFKCSAVGLGWVGLVVVYFKWVGLVQG